VDERLALLRAILASPDEDMPRLAFADWLDEHATTDAEAARAEFIRLGCRMKDGKRPIQKAESEWLRANWRRLFPAMRAAIEPFAIVEKWKGRYLEARILREDGKSGRASCVVFEFTRGFAARIRFKKGDAYERLRDVLAKDDPVAVFGPYEGPKWSGESDDRVVRIGFEDWGSEVLERITDHTLEGDTTVYFTATSMRPEWKVEAAAHDALTAAMTRIAREANGLADPPPPESA
jgi:uncharacterized protein (TIGR02996 family)